MIAISFVQKFGLKCDAYEDGKLAYEALKKASKEDNPYHLVLMDVQMPVLDGYNATRAIRKDEDRRVREVLVIAMTASAIRGDREKCLEAGMNDYLAKPVRQAALKEMLDEYLNSKRVPQNVVSPKSGDKASPDDEVNKEAAEVPSKSVKSAAESKEIEGLGLSINTSHEDNLSKETGDQTNGVISPIPSIIVSPTESNDISPAKPRKKRVPLKGSKRNAPENGTQTSTSQTDGDNPPSLNPNQKEGDKRTNSPPSGVKETQDQGKVSTEVVSPKENGANKGEMETLLSKTPSEQNRNADEKKKSATKMTKTI